VFLRAVGTLCASALLCAGCSSPGSAYGAAITWQSLQRDAHGIATCATLGVATPSQLPTSSSPEITALVKRGIRTKTLRLIENFSPARCATAQDVIPILGQRMYVVEFPTQLTRHNRDVLSVGEATYLRRTRAFVYVHNSADR
jgi:hypothetical protein